MPFKKKIPSFWEQTFPRSFQKYEHGCNLSLCVAKNVQFSAANISEISFKILSCFPNVETAVSNSDFRGICRFTATNTAGNCSRFSPDSPSFLVVNCSDVSSKISGYVSTNTAGNSSDILLEISSFQLQILPTLDQKYNIFFTPMWLEIVVTSSGVLVTNRVVNVLKSL